MLKDQVSVLRASAIFQSVVKQPSAWMAECYTFTVEDVCVLNIVDVNAVEAG